MPTKPTEELDCLFMSSSTSISYESLANKIGSTLSVFGARFVDLERDMLFHTTDQLGTRLD